MVKIIHGLIISGLFFVSLATNSEEFVEKGLTVGIPYNLISDVNKSNVYISDDNITVVAVKGSDLYTNSDGSTSTDNAPRLYFEPKSDFTFSAKVRANFTTAYDGGALFVYADKGNWGKLLFERFKSGNNGIASTVTKITGDDAYHNLITDNEIHLKIMRKKDTFTFFYSEDGKDWIYRRSFSFKSPKKIKVGFLAQSPISETHKVVYSDIQFKE